MDRRSVAALVALALLAGCGTSHTSQNVRREGDRPRVESTAPVTSVSHPYWAPPSLPSSDGGISNCGLSYLVQVGSKALRLGTCSGLLPKNLIKPLVVTPGTVFYIRVTHEMDGSLDYPVPTPSSPVLVQTARRGFIAQYRAARPGIAYLIAHGTNFCEGIDPRRGSCRVLVVRVQRG